MKKKILIIVLLIIVTPLAIPGFFANPLEKPLRVYQEPVSVDVIVVHGGGTTSDNNLPLLAQQRLNQGLQLWRTGLAPQILVTGGPTSKHNVEADIMAQELEKRGVPAVSIVEEDKSQNTHENVINSLEIIKKNEFKSALIVTSPYHSLRTSLVWKKLWPDGRTYITPASKTITQSGVNPYRALFSVLREYLAMAWYKINGWI